MTKDKFQSLCESVLLPRLGDLMHRQLLDLDESLEIMSRELIRIDAKLAHIASIIEQKLKN
jgi:hypothetical protein